MVARSPEMHSSPAESAIWGTAMPDHMLMSQVLAQLTGYIKTTRWLCSSTVIRCRSLIVRSPGDHYDRMAIAEMSFRPPRHPLHRIHQKGERRSRQRNPRQPSKQMPLFRLSGRVWHPLTSSALVKAWIDRHRAKRHRTNPRVVQPQRRENRSPQGKDNVRKPLGENPEIADEIDAYNRVHNVAAHKHRQTTDTDAGQFDGEQLPKNKMRLKNLDRQPLRRAFKYSKEWTSSPVWYVWYSGLTKIRTRRRSRGTVRIVRNQFAVWHLRESLLFELKAGATPVL